MIKIEKTEKTMMTIYVKQLLSQLNDAYGELTPAEFASKLFQIGVVDHTLCKVLAVRREVECRVAQGDKKIDAMWGATELFCCSYEYVRKCMYYYKDVNLV